MEILGWILVGIGAAIVIGSGLASIVIQFEKEKEDAIRRRKAKD